MLKKIIRIATRQSPLALWQAHHVGNMLKNQWPNLDYRLVPMQTSGDRFLKDKLQTLGGKGLFVKELEEGLLANTADIAVHSMKDVPSSLPEGLVMAGICKRDSPFDALISLRFQSLGELPAGSLVGTASLRRQSQLLALKPELRIEPLRGNIQTRLERLEEGKFDAILLAVAGLERMGYCAKITEILDASQMLPACAQGALGIECRKEDLDMIACIQPLNHAITALCIETEREVNARLGGNCHIPLAVYCFVSEALLHLTARVLSLDGKTLIETAHQGPLNAAPELAAICSDTLLSKGAGDLLASAR